MAKLGFKIAIYANDVRRATITAARGLWRDLRETETLSREMLGQRANAKVRLKPARIDDSTSCRTVIGTDHAVVAHCHCTV